MRLVYEATGKEVAIGDAIQDDRHGLLVVLSFDKPHKPDASGKVYVYAEAGWKQEFYVSVIGAKWIEREDQPSYH